MESPDSSADSDLPKAEVRSGNDHDQLRFFDTYVRHLSFLTIAAAAHCLGTASGNWSCWLVFLIASALLALNCRPVALDLVWLWRISPIGQVRKMSEQAVHLFAGGLAGLSIASAMALSAAATQVIAPS